MRLNGPPPWDLIASALISVLALVLVHLSPPSMRGLSTILGFVLAIPLFGYLLVLSLFPAQSELSSRTRALLSLGASTFLIAIISLVLIPRGLQLTYAATILSLLTLIMAAIAYVRWSALPRRRRFILWSTRGRRPRRTSASSLLVGAGDSIVSLLSLLGSRGRALLSLGASTFLAAFAYIRWTALPPRNRLAVRSMRGRRSWRSLASSPLASTKGQFVSLLFVLVIICALAVPVFFTNNANQTPSSEIVNKVDSPSSLNREDHLWTNSYNIKLNELNNSSDINVSAKNTPVTVEQKSQAVVMEVNNGSSSGNSTPSEEKPSFQESSEKISVQGSSVEKSNPQNNSEPFSNETAIIPSSESSKENQTTNPESLQEDKSKDELELSNTPLAESSNDKVPSPGSNNNPTGDDSNRTEKTAIKINISQENGTDTFRENQTYNFPPFIADLRPNKPNPQIEGTTIIWMANAYDPDGDMVFYKFLLDDKVMTNWSASNSWTWNTSSLAPGDYRIKVLIRDGKHASEDAFDGSKEMTFSLIQPNQRPVLEDLRPNMDSPQASGKSITWTANATDPDGDMVFYKFLLDDKVMTNWSASNSWTWNTSSLAPGDYRIKVLIRDGKHASEDSFDGSKEMTFSLIQPNQPPVLGDLRPDMVSPQASGKSIVWTANATDPDGDLVLYKFLINDQPATVWSRFNNFNWVTTKMAPGDYRIKVLIRDGKHASEDAFDGSKEVIFTLIRPNQRPVLEDLRPNMDSPQASGKSIVWTANATDPDGDVILYRFLLNDKAMANWSASNSWTWNTSSIAPGDYRIKVLIRDGKHASEDSFDGSKEVKFTLMRPNQPPVLEDLIPDMDSPQTSGKSITWTANATDPDGDMVLYRFLLDDKAMTNWSASNSWIWNTSSIAPGDYRIKVLIRDGKHASEDSSDGSKEEKFTLIRPNQPPVIEDLRPSMDSPQASGKSIVWTANATDPDGDLVLYKFLINDQPATVWSRFNNFNWITTKMAPGDYRIKVLIRDGKHASEDSFDGSKEVIFTLTQPNQRPVLGDLRPDMVSPQVSGKSIGLDSKCSGP